MWTLLLGRRQVGLEGGCSGKGLADIRSSTGGWRGDEREDV